MLKRSMLAKHKNDNPVCQMQQDRQHVPPEETLIVQRSFKELGKCSHFTLAADN